MHARFLLFFLCLSSFVIHPEYNSLKKIKIFGKSIIDQWHELKSEGSKEWLIERALADIVTLDYPEFLVALAELRQFIQTNSAQLPASKDKWLTDVIPGLEARYKKVIESAQESKHQNTVLIETIG